MDFDRLVVGFVVDEVVGGFFISVPPGHIACIYDRGRGVLPRVWGPGLHLKIPFWQIAKLFNAQILEYNIRNGFDTVNKESLGDTPITALTRDGKEITMEGSILFRINKRQAPQLWENVGDNFVSKVVRPISRNTIGKVLSEFEYEAIASHRSDVEQRLVEALNQEFSNKGLICEGVLPSDTKLVTKQVLRGQLEETS